MPKFCNNFCPKFESLKLEWAVFPLSPASYVYDFVVFVSSKGPNVRLYIIGEMLGFLVACWEHRNLHAVRLACVVGFVSLLMKRALGIETMET